MNGEIFMKINKSFVILLCAVFSLLLLKSIQRPIANKSADNAIQTIIEPNLLKNIKIDSFQKNDTAEQYKQWLNDEIVTIWQEIEEITKISLDDCMTYKAKTYERYLKKRKKLQDSFRELVPVDPEIITLLETVLRDFKVNPDSISIVPFNHFCPAAGDDCTLFINQELFKKLSPFAQKFSIAHELQHFIYQDNSLKRALEKLTGLDNATLPQDHPMNKLSRMLELRADILGASAGSDYAQGYKEFVDKTIQIIGQGKGVTHPKSNLRLSYAEQIKTILA